MNNLLEKQKGITLVALVITIIVMLILASVTISMLVNGGLIDKAKGATSDTKTATENEQNIIKEYENLIDEYAAPSSGVKNGIIAEEGSLFY
jgi:flagellar basal body-associated protein FliL